MLGDLNYVLKGIINRGDVHEILVVYKSRIKLSTVCLFDKLRYDRERKNGGKESGGRHKGKGGLSSTLLLHSLGLANDFILEGKTKVEV